MGWGNNVPPPSKPNHPCPPNNPHCQGVEPPSVSIDIPEFKECYIVLIIIFGCYVIWKRLKQIREQKCQKLIKK